MRLDSGRIAAAIAALAILTACGGGGGSSSSGSGDSPDRSFGSFDKEEAIRLTNSMAPEETIADQLARAPTILTRTDALIVSTFYGETDSPQLPTFNLEPDCIGTTCTFTEPQTGLSTTVDISEAQDLVANTDIQREVLTRNDITLLEARGSVNVGPNYRIYGAWMEHGSFAVETGGDDTVEDVTIRGRVAQASGDLTGTRPSTNATWRGVMVGTPARGNRRDNILQGDAELTYTASNSEIDAQFTNIVNLDREAPHSVREVRFDDIPVANDGTYGAGSAGNLISGGFGGPNHEETGGIFEQQNIVGAYGAKAR